MLLLFETSAGLALFKVLQENKLEEVDDLHEHFSTLEDAQKVVKLKAFSKFENTTDALATASALVDSKLSKGMKKFLKKNAAGETLAVLDAKLGGLIKEKLEIPCVYNNGIQELARGVRSQLQGLIRDDENLPFEGDFADQQSHSIQEKKAQNAWLLTCAESRVVV